MKNLQEFKKVEKGKKFKLIYAKHTPHKFLGYERAVRHVQSNALTFEPMPEIGSVNPSWLYFPKAKEFIGTEKGFKILEENGDVGLEYEEVN